MILKTGYQASVKRRSGETAGRVREKPKRTIADLESAFSATPAPAIDQPAYILVLPPPPTLYRSIDR